MKIEIDVEFEIGEAVEYKDKRGMDSGFITGYKLTQGQTIYLVTWSDKREIEHYNFELKKSNNGKN